MPTPASRNRVFRMIARWPGEFIHARTITAGVAPDCAAQPMFSPSDHRHAPRRYPVRWTRSRTVVPFGVSCAKNRRATMSTLWRCAATVRSPLATTGARARRTRSALTRQMIAWRAGEIVRADATARAPEHPAADADEAPAASRNVAAAAETKKVRGEGIPTVVVKDRGVLHANLRTVDVCPLTVTLLGRKALRAAFRRSCDDAHSEIACIGRA